MPSDSLTRLFVPVRIGDVPTEAVLDTGGAYFVLGPQLANDLALRRERAILTGILVIRGLRCPGSIHRVPVTIPAEAGEALTFEATAFVPELGPNEEWPLPSYLGWQGCLDRIRLALDPAEERVYFGAAA